MNEAPYKSDFAERVGSASCAAKVPQIPTRAQSFRGDLWNLNAGTGCIGSSVHLLSYTVAFGAFLPMMLPLLGHAAPVRLFSETFSSLCNCTLLSAEERQICY